MDNFNANSIEENFPNVCRCCLIEGCYKDISSEYFISGKKEVYAEMLKDVFNLEISYQKYRGRSLYSRLICENCIGKLRDAKEFKYKVLASEKSFIDFLDDIKINIKVENIQEANNINLENCEVECCEKDVLENSQFVNYYDLVGIKLESESNTDNEIESHETLEDQTGENHTGETEDSIPFVISKGALMPGDSRSDKGGLLKGKDTSPFVSSSNEVDNLLKITLSLEKLKDPLSEDFHDTNIPEGRSKKKFKTKQSNSKEKSTLSKEKTMKRKSYCLFCQNLVSNYYRHIIIKHSAEPEVKGALAQPIRSLERKNIFTALRERGNKEFHSIKQPPRHIIKCDYTLSKKNARDKKQKSHLRYVKVDYYLKNKVFPLMEPDTISLIAQKDKIICMFGEHHFRKYGETHSIKTSHKMRDLAKLLVEVTKLKPEISCLKQVLKPQCYTTLVDASKNVIQYNNDEKHLEALTYVLNIADSLKQCCRLAILECSLVEDTPESAKFKEDLKALTLLVNRNWRQDIATLAHRNDNCDSD